MITMKKVTRMMMMHDDDDERRSKEYDKLSAMLLRIDNICFFSLLFCLFLSYLA